MSQDFGSLHFDGLPSPRAIAQTQAHSAVGYILVFLLPLDNEEAAFLVGDLT